MPGCCPSRRCEFVHYLIFDSKTSSTVQCPVIIASLFPVVLTHDVLKKARGNLEVSKVSAALNSLMCSVEIGTAVSVAFCRISPICFGFAIGTTLRSSLADSSLP